MDSLKQERADFRRRKAREIAEAQQRVALRLCCGIDLPDAGTASREELAQALAKVGRAARREQMKAAGAHWSYDLNRHIALVEARNDLRRLLAGPGSAVPACPLAKKRSGARRRRHVWHA